MTDNLSGTRVVIMLAYGFEEVEVTSPKRALEQAGAKVKIIGLRDGMVQGVRHGEPAGSVRADLAIEDANADDFDALVIPGGVFSPDALRQDAAALSFVRRFFEDDKPVASICHGPQVLISANLVKDRRMTAIAPVQTDLENAGAKVEDSPVVVDGKLVTSRAPGDLDAFNEAFIRMLGACADARAEAP